MDPGLVNESSPIGKISRKGSLQIDRLASRNFTLTQRAQSANAVHMWVGYVSCQGPQETNAEH